MPICFDPRGLRIVRQAAIRDFLGNITAELNGHHLQHDLLERHNIAFNQPEVVTRLQRAYDGWNGKLA